MSDGLSPPPPWYRQLWPWLIMLPPAAAVLGGLATLYVAGAVPPMVVDDYGRIGLVTEQRVARDQRADALGLTGRLRIDWSGSGGLQGVGLILEANYDVDLPGTVVLELIHPTLAERDRQTALLGAAGSYRGQIDRPPGRYYLQLSDVEQSWRLTGELTDRATELTLGAAASQGNMEDGW